MPRFKLKSATVCFTAVTVFAILLLCYSLLTSSAYQVLLEKVHGRKLKDRHNFPTLLQNYRRYLMENADYQVEQSKGDKFPPKKYLPQNLTFSKTVHPLFNNTTRIISKTILLLENRRRTPVNRSNILREMGVPLQQNNTRQSTHIQEECSDVTCSEHLSREDRERFLTCVGAVRNASVTPSNGDCHFINGENRQPVALVSFPGSGNTWVRGLLETATGICTGAVYCDISLRATGFTGEFIRSGSTLVVKTHESDPFWLDSQFPWHVRHQLGRYGSAIFIVRNPFKALVAEWNRKVANDFHAQTIRLDSHVKAISQEWFGENKRWDAYVHSQAKRWLSMIDKWVVNSNHHPILVVKYEKLKRESFTEVIRMLDFLRIDYNHMELKNNVKEDFNLFFRKKNKVNFEHYTKKQITCISSIIRNATMLLNKNNIGELIELEEYYSLYNT